MRYRRKVHVWFGWPSIWSKYYSGFNVFSYLTFRAIVSLLTALFISLWMGAYDRSSAKTLFGGWYVTRWRNRTSVSGYADDGRHHDP
ncbi:hypothetical protein KCP76_14210 [Salmonella enterica subsp. enterica serovar Weltevreden]|nr:hypothetical protein KCP76_14210 [Salmonella enterica subsp. enterica serovar Weltevreden]